MIRVLLISSVTPSKTSAGQIVLHRHLVDRREINLQVLQTEPRKTSLSKLARGALGCLGRTRFHRFVQDVWALWRGGWIDAELPVPAKSDLPTVVITVAHGEACMAAMRYAKLHNLPLVTFFHDWWPDIPHVHQPFRQRLERSFRMIYENSKLALCVSPGMMEALGEHPNAKLLFPIPAASQTILEVSESRDPKHFRLLYSGNLGDYAPMLKNALEVLKDHPTIRLEVRGSNPEWPESFKEEMCERGMWLPFAPRDELDTWLQSADGFLIPQDFSDVQKRRMMTNFPSKVTEFARFGKPLIIWAPHYASASVWAQTGGHALVVNDAEAHVLAKAVIGLYADSGRSMDVASRVSGCFDSAQLQQNFLDLLHGIFDETMQS